MPKYKVVIERIIQETIEIDAENETEALDQAFQGEGEVVDDYEDRPTIIYTEELDDDRPEWSVSQPDIPLVGNTAVQPDSASTAGDPPTVSSTDDS